MSTQSEDAIYALVRKHRLSRMLNPGGIALTTPSGRSCQISEYEDEDDFAKLQKFLAHACPLPPTLAYDNDINFVRVTWGCLACGQAWIYEDGEWRRA